MTFTVPAYSTPRMTVDKLDVAGDPTQQCADGDFLSISANATSCGVASSINGNLCGKITTPVTQTFPVQSVDYQIKTKFTANGDNKVIGHLQCVSVLCNAISCAIFTYINIALTLTLCWLNMKQIPRLLQTPVRLTFMP
jgi:hypothetical protein